MQTRVAFEIYEKMKEEGIEALIDDRDERAGVKFNDADLIGVPLRINVGARSLKENKVEIGIRKTREVISVGQDQAVEKCKELLSSL
ncbi:MAG: His/Gly/Thr/Pro-type tRNA ligase C-terminal domain-containing protein, partial [Candidatus Zixiibacteriota bacterium]